MKHIEYWESEDGSRFNSKAACMEYEIRLLEKNNEILYYDKDGNKVDDFDSAWVVVLSKELNDEDYKELWEWYGWMLPNAEGKYVWNEELEDWE